MAKTSPGFRNYVRDKREKKGLSYNKIATALEVSKPYIYDIEQGNNKPPLDYSKLNAWAEVLELTRANSRNKLFDLSVEGRKMVPPDITKAILENPKIKAAIRSVIKNNLPDEVWDKLINPDEEEPKEEENDEE